ncbi:MAG: amidohydrolase family protein [Chloroflexi bacterium]|nr:amidohydrolase family protein [Chloroflexota bacterium]
MLIDSHNHSHYNGVGPEGLIAEMDAFGIDLAWLLTWYLPPSEHVPSSHRAFNPRNVRPDGTHAGVILADVLETCQRFPARFVAGYCPCPTEGNAADLFEAAYRVYGVRICGEWSYRTVLDDPRAIELFRRAGQLHCPVVLHIDAPYLPDAQGKPVYQEFWYGGNLEALARALQACPATIFIGHAPGFWRYLSGDEATERAIYPAGPIQPGGRLLELFEQFPNLWADLSAGSGLGALRRDPGFARDFLIRYADRLLYGRDNKGNALQEFLKTLDLPQTVRDKLFFQNAQKLVPLE